MSNDLIVYLKTTDTCQLNCSHCFTNGSSGKKGWFDVDKTAAFFHNLKRYKNKVQNGHYSFHGGEPMLAPTPLLFSFYDQVKDLWPNMWWTVQTNLTYKLTDDKLDVFDTICKKNIGTSWDYGIRWTSKAQQNLWEENVKALIAAGHEITVMVSLNSRLIKEKQPIEIINELSNLGIQHINFERLTPNGNATRNPQIFPNNLELDQWFLTMWEQCLAHRTWTYVDNMFLDSILTSTVYNTYSGCRSRQCEQKIYTINADGTVGGCPNDAVGKVFGSINDPIEKIIFSPDRMCNVQKESLRHPVCMTCPVFNICNGDCHQLAWQDDVCAAPKSLMQRISSEPRPQLYKEIMGHFMGQE